MDVWKRYPHNENSGSPISPSSSTPIVRKRLLVECGRGLQPGQDQSHALSSLEAIASSEALHVAADPSATLVCIRHGQARYGRACRISGKSQKIRKLVTLLHGKREPCASLIRPAIEESSPFLSTENLESDLKRLIRDAKSIPKVSDY